MPEVPIGHSAAVKAATVLILDIAGMVHIVRLTLAPTFNDYVSHHLVPFLESQVTPIVTRVDAIWDTYTEGNDKTPTHQHHDLGPHTRIGDGQILVPKHWNTGILNIQNKKELFPFLITQLVKKDLSRRPLLSTSHQHGECSLQQTT